MRDPDSAVLKRVEDSLAIRRLSGHSLRAHPPR